MTFEYYIPNWMLKRAAKQLSRQYDISQTAALDKLAKEQGFQDWAALQHTGNYVCLDENPNDWIDSAKSKIASSMECQ